MATVLIKLLDRWLLKYRLIYTKSYLFIRYELSNFMQILTKIKEVTFLHTIKVIKFYANLNRNKWTKCYCQVLFKVADDIWH